MIWKIQFRSKVPRQEYLLLRILSDAEFSLYKVLKECLTDWDPRHTSYGFFDFDIKSLSKIIYWSEDKVRRNINKLLQKNLIFKEDENIYGLTGFEITDACFKKRTSEEKAMSTFANLKATLEATLQKSTLNTTDKGLNLDVIFADLQITPLDTLDLPTTNRSKSRFNLVSSKGYIVYKEEEKSQGMSEEEKENLAQGFDNYLEGLRKGNANEGTN